MTHWYVQQGANRDDLGPLRPNELLDLIRCGEVTKASLVRKGDSPWFAAGDVGGLFEAAMRPTIQYFCPQCEAEVSEPPVTCLRCGRDIRKGITKITEHAIIQRTDEPTADSNTGSVKRWLQEKKARKSPENDRS